MRFCGAPAWLKPAKFAISSAIFCGSLAWLYRYITVWPRFLKTMGWAVSAVLIRQRGAVGRGSPGFSNDAVQQ